MYNLKYRLLFRKKLGFTLIELLVSVSIVAVLAAVGIALFSGSQSAARDSKRKGDIDAIAKALEMKKTPGEQFYSAIGDSDFSGSKGSIPTNSADGTAEYCIAITATSNRPVDPTTWVNTDPCPTEYTIFSSSTSFDNAVGWKVCARLESSTTGTLKTYCQSSAQ